VQEGYSLIHASSLVGLCVPYIVAEVSTPHVYASFLGSLHGSLCEVAETLPAYRQDAVQATRVRSDV
jgi:hypothetical protein